MGALTTDTRRAHARRAAGHRRSKRVVGEQQPERKSTVVTELLRRDDQAELWERYRRGSSEARDRLIVSYAPLVQFVRGRVGASLPPSIDQGDLVSAGVIGLIAALERFDEARDVKFETYAFQRIRGAMLDELRAGDWVPRSVRAKTREIEGATSKLQTELRRAPSIEELAEELTCDADALRHTIHTAISMSMIALEDLTSVTNEEGDTVSLLETLADTGVEQPGDALEEAFLRSALREAIESLSQQDRTVIVLYYFEGLTLAKIGASLGVTESRASQIHSKALAALRSQLTEALSAA